MVKVNYALQYNFVVNNTAAIAARRRKREREGGRDGERGEQNPLSTNARFVNN